MSAKHVHDEEAVEHPDGKVGVVQPLGGSFERYFIDFVEDALECGFFAFFEVVVVGVVDGGVDVVEVIFGGLEGRGSDAEVFFAVWHLVVDVVVC